MLCNKVSFSYCVLLLVASGGPIWLEGGVRRIDSSTEFSENAIWLEFASLGGISNAKTVYSRLGVSFEAEEGRASTVLKTLRVIPPISDTFLDNVPISGTSSGKRLVVRFTDPVKWAGFQLRTPTVDAVAELTALDAFGTVLGTVVSQGALGFFPGDFVGIEVDEGMEISSIVVDFGEDEAPESTAELVFELIDPKTFRNCVAVFSHGSAFGRNLQTTLRVQNPFDAGFPPRLKDLASGRLKVFDNEGTPLPVALNEQVGDTFDVDVPLFGLQGFGSSGPDVPQTGYACVEALLPLAMHAIFRTTRLSDGRVWEAGLTGGEPLAVHVLGVERNRQEAIGTGIAIANPGPEDAVVRLMLKSPDALAEVSIGVLGKDVNIELPAGHQRAFFVGELFEELAEEDFQGTVLAVSDHPVVITTLRTVDGFPVSSLPISSPQR